MTKLKDIDFKILSELMKNSKASDRKLAKKIGVSQPTVTRRRARLEKEVIESYTAIPKWEKLGYNLIVITLIKVKMDTLTKENYEPTRKQGLKWFKNQPKIIMAGTCRGPTTDFFLISVHKNYPDYDEFIRDYRLEWGKFIEDVQPVLVNLAGNEIMKPLNLSYLAEAK